MPWQEVSTMALREEFVMLAQAEGANRSELCRRFGISRKTGYKWLERSESGAPGRLADQSRRPHASPRQTAVAVTQALLALRDAHPAWGARTLRRRLHDSGWQELPAPSTVHAILLRQGRIEPQQGVKHQAWQRFEHAAPNDLWQMDFKGHFAIGSGRCHPLTVLDDHSRFNLCLQACANEQGLTVQTHLRAVFRRYGLPRWIAVDNGSPWGDGGGSSYTPLVVWWLRLGIGCSHSQPYHPQTLGKDERFHRTLKAEVLDWETFPDLPSTQRRFDGWRVVYNFERPHHALGLRTPATCYTPSPRPFPEQLPPIEYGPDDIVRKVQQQGWISYRNHLFRLSRAFTGYPVALRPTTTDGVFDVFFCHHQITQIDVTIV